MICVEYFFQGWWPKALTMTEQTCHTSQYFSHFLIWANFSTFLYQLNPVDMMFLDFRTLVLQVPVSQPDLWHNRLSLSVWCHIPYGHLFVSKLFHFQSNLLLIGCESSGDWQKSFSPCTQVEDRKEAPYSWLWSPPLEPLGYLNSESKEGRSLYLSFSLPLSSFALCSSAFQIITT